MVRSVLSRAVRSFLGGQRQVGCRLSAVSQVVSGYVVGDGKVSDIVMGAMWLNASVQTIDAIVDVSE
jgi:hypothetical protein